MEAVPRRDATRPHADRAHPSAGEPDSDGEARYRWLIENTSDAVWRFELDEPIPVDLPEDEQLDRCFRLAYLAECNAAMATMYGYPSREALVGMRLPELMPPDKPENIEYLRAFARNGYRIAEAESSEVAADGSPRYFVNSLIAEVTDGHLVRAWGTSRDVTAQKRTEAELRQSRAMLRTVLDNLPLGVFWKDRESSFLGMNAVGMRAAGFAGPDDVVGKTDFDLPGVTHEQAEFFRAKDREVVESGQPQHDILEPITRADGSTRWLNTHKIPLLDADGDVVGVLGTAEDVTERRRTESELRQSRAMLRTVLDNIPQGVFWKDRDSVYVGVNAVAAREAGFAEPADQIGLTDFDVPGVTKEQAEFFRRKDREVIESGRPQHDILEPISRPDGSTSWLNTHKLPLSDAEGNVIGVLGTWEDVTERRRAEEAIRESEAWVRTVTDNLPALVSYLDRDLRYRFANAAYRDWFGLEPAAVVGKTVEEVIGTEMLAHRRGYLEAVVRGEPVQFDGPTLHRRLGWRQTEVLYTPDIGPDGEVRGFFVLVHDATERKEAEQRHREADEQFRTLADSIPHLAWMADPTGWIFWYNRRWYEYTGMTPESQEGWGWKSVQDPAELPRVVAKWEAALAAGEPWEDVFPLRRHDGQMRWHLSRAMPVRDADGKIVRWFGTNTDVTGQRELEQALREADRRKDEFLATLGHELRNPLASIVNAAEAIAPGRNGRPDCDGAEMVEIVERQARHMSRLIDDLLDVARIARGKVLLRAERIDLAELVRQTAEDHRREIEEAGLSLAVEVFNRPLWVEGDRTRLAQVLGNLLHNAVKFTDLGGKIIVAVAQEEGGATVRVRDTGLGMAPEMLTRVFVPFSQADASLGRSRGGLGLGLALVKGLVDLHGGAVSARSEGLGLGAEFVIRLPLVEAPAVATDDQDGGSCGTEGLRILAIDDRRDILRPLQVLLAREGHEVEAATTGRGGVDAARQMRPDVVICDIGLPGDMNGHDVARALRADDELSGVRLIALTGYGQESDRQAALAAGFDLHLTKPVDIRVLRSALAGMMPVPR